MSDPDPSLRDAASASADSLHWLAPWRRRLLFWSGAVLVGLLAVGFAKGSDLAFRLFERVRGHGLAWPLLLTPATFALLAWLTNGALRATRGSGIPQAMAALQVEDAGFRARLLSLRVAAGKMALTLTALLGGASVGREGPTVHVGAGVMYSLARRFGFADAAGASRFVLAGGAAGIAAAFNTPLAGVVFAIEEMAGAYEHRMSGILLSAAELNRPYRILRVLVQDPERLVYLGELGLYPNAAVTVLSRAPFAGPLLIDVGGDQHALAHEMAEFLVVAA